MLQLIKDFFDFVLHIDIHLQNIVTDYRTWTYLILFAIIFCETGLVVTPFLPGDSLIFAAGTIAAMEGQPLNIVFLVLLLITAAFTGDNTNYFIGRFIGEQVYERDFRLIKREYLTKTHVFYEKHGGKALILARFMPIIRTFAPFVAGVGTMRYLRFFSFSIIGNILWVNIFALAGYFFGNIPFIKKNFSIAIMTIILVSLLPIIITLIRNMASRKKLSTKS
ncbi:MAG: DedA family protein [Bacteroidetes bacterium]|nr:DedA family protein [Bacteroidota bacterium]